MEENGSQFTLLLSVVALLMFAPLAMLASARLQPTKPFEVVRGGSAYPRSEIGFEFEQIGKLVHHPRILNVNVVNLDEAGPPEVLICDSQRGRVILYSQNDLGRWSEQPISDELASPAHTSLADLDNDGDQDILVAVLGDPWPTDERVGAVVWLENDGALNFKTHVILDDMRRVTDVQAGDFDKDGDLDLAVAEFGFSRGGVWELENVGEMKFVERQLFAGPGAIHAPVCDLDKDGDLDIVTVVTQEEEEIWAFENQGSGEFKPRLISYDPNFDLGAAGLVVADLDKDGDQDLIMPAGDNLDLLSHHPQPYHGCYWFENQGDWKFERKRISNLGGAYAASVGDLDGDEDQDIVLVSLCNNWMQDGNASVVWLENDGKQNFKSWQVADQPIHLVTVATGDLNEDGRLDIIAGGMHMAAPHDRLGRVSVWLSSEDVVVSRAGGQR